MAIHKYYVDSDVAPGGAGTSADPFSSLNEFELLNPNSATEDFECYCTGTSADTTSVIFAGWTANSVTIIGEITSAVWEDDIYTLAVSNTKNINVIQAIDITFKKIQLDCTGYAGINQGALYFNNSSGVIYAEVDSCIFRQSTSDAYNYCDGIQDYNCLALSLYVKNSISYGFKSNSSAGYYLWEPTTSADFYNCTVCDCNFGFGRAGGVLNVVNSVSFSASDDFNGSFNTLNYNASDDGDGTNPISASGGDWINEMPNYTSYNFNITSSGNVYEGSSLTNADDPLVPTIDIVGNIRNSGVGENVSVGVVEFFSSSPPISGDDSKSLLDGLLINKSLINGRLVG